MWDMYLYLWFETCTCICSDERHVCVFVVIYMTCACTYCDVRHVHTWPVFVVIWETYLHLLWMWREACTCICFDVIYIYIPVFVVMWDMYLHLLWWEACTCICCDVRHVPVLVMRGMYPYLLWWEDVPVFVVMRGCTCICCDERHVPVFAVMRGCTCICCDERHVPVFAVMRGCTCICCDERHVPVFAVMRGCTCICCDERHVPVFAVMRVACFFAEWRKEGVRAVVGYCTPGVGLGGNVTNTSSRIHLPCQACGSLHCGARMQWQDWAVLVSVLILLPVIDGLQGED